VAKALRPLTHPQGYSQNDGVLYWAGALGISAGSVTAALEAKNAALAHRD
jgi:hypothetical protein